MLLFLIRHGQTDSNVNKILDGEYPGPPLNATGETQARLLAQKLVDIPLDKVFSSDIVRAVQTADAIATLKDLPHEILPGLREIPAGDLQGTSDGDAYHAMIAAWKTDLDFARPGGESGRQFFSRYDEAMATIASSGCERVAAVSHAAAMTTWLAARVIGDTSQAPTARTLNNTDVVALSHDENGWRCCEWQVTDFSCWA